MKKQDKSEKKERKEKQPEKKEKQESKKITFSQDKDKNFSEWYSEIVEKAELVDIRYNVKGFVVFRPWATRIMETMYDALEQELQAKGHEPAWFPSLIPESNFKKESQHLEGFEPSVFWVTEAADSKFEERLALRPTSETAIYPMYAIWIRGYKDLPLKIYQRAQIWRYETKATRPLIRSREFYWIESHNCFSTKEEAEAQVLEDIDTTEKFMHEKLGVPFLPLRRPSWDMFPGAVYTIGSDSLLPDGRVIQQPSTHFLGQNFSKMFNIQFKDKHGKQEYVWQTCYGPCISRILASVIAIHGDNSGLVLPFAISPLQIVIIPIFNSNNKNKVLEKCKNLEQELKLKNIRVKIDLTEKTPGEKFYFWEMKGVPLRLEIGEKELQGPLTLFLRNERKKIKVNDIKDIDKIGKDFDVLLRIKAEKWLDSSIITCKSRAEIEEALKNKKIARVNFCSIDKQGTNCAEVVEKELNAFVRGIRHDKKEQAHGKCIFCGKPATQVVYIAKSY
jgi:prolyl-tRNA synthetase